MKVLESCAAATLLTLALSGCGAHDPADSAVGTTQSAVTPASVPAPAGVEWAQLPPQSACVATAIGVGANNIPWILGCGQDSWKGVYYLANSPGAWVGNLPNYRPTCSQLVCTPTWVYDGCGPSTGGSTCGVTLFVNQNGVPFSTDTGGVIWAEGMSLTHKDSGSIVPQGASSWGPMRNSTIYSNGSGGGAVSSFVVSTWQALNGAQPFVMWGSNNVDPPAMGLYSGQLTFWGTGCGSNCQTAWTPSTNGSDAALYTETLYDGTDYTTSGWAYRGGGAVQVALFTDPPDGDTPNQNPWYISDEGGIYFWNGGGWQQAPGGAGPAISITDHFVLTSSGDVYQWNGTADGTGNASWSLYMTPFDATTGFVLMTQIAWSQAIAGTPNGTIGPSQLWGIDQGHNVYVASPIPQGQPK